MTYFQWSTYLINQFIPLHSFPWLSRGCLNCDMINWNTPKKIQGKYINVNHNPSITDGKVLVATLVVIQEDYSSPHSPICLSIIRVQNQSFLTVCYCLLVFTHFAVSSSPTKMKLQVLINTWLFYANDDIITPENIHTVTVTTTLGFLHLHLHVAGNSSWASDHSFLLTVLAFELALSFPSACYNPITISK